MELPLFFWQLREVVLMSDLTHIPRRSFVTKAIREPPPSGTKTGTKQDGGGKRTRRRSVRVSILTP